MSPRGNRGGKNSPWGQKWAHERENWATPRVRTKGPKRTMRDTNSGRGRNTHGHKHSGLTGWIQETYWQYNGYQPQAGIEHTRLVGE